MTYLSPGKLILLFAVATGFSFICISCSGFGGKEEGSTTSLIKDISTVAAFEAIVDTTRGSLVGFDLWAPWCGACRMVKPVLEQVAKNNQGKVILYRVNVQKLPEIAQCLGVRGIPYVLFVKDKVPVTAVTGAREAEVYQEIIDPSSSLGTQAHTPDGM